MIANTKGFTGHAMATGIEDVVAIKALETGCVPPVANFKEVDPELGLLNLSKGGDYPVEYALRLGAGFGSQISMTLLRWVKTKDGVRPGPNALGYATRIADANTWKAWLSKLSGVPEAELEVVHRTLRVRDERAAARIAEIAQDARAETTISATTPVVQPAPAPAVIPKPEPLIAHVEVAKTITPVMSVTTSVKIAAPAPVVSAPLIESPAAVKDFSVKERILNLAVEKTGYPKDMLDLDLDLEADLGVDTVKQAEMFAAIREIYSIPRDENRKLREFPTLAHVIQFVYDKRPDLVAQLEAPAAVPVMEPPKTIEAPPSPVAEGAATDSVKERILTLAVEKTGYPKDMLDLDLDLEADLGVDTVKQAEMFAAIREIYSIPRDENRKLREFPTLAHVIQFVYDKRPDLVAKTLSSTVMAVKEEEKAVEAPPPSVAEDVAEDAVKRRILALAVEKTGYPEDMLDLDLDLEADLGVDTVKQAEMFAAIREIYNIPRDENRKLREFPTLKHVIQFVYDKRPDLVAKVSAPTVAPVVEEPRVFKSHPASVTDEKP